MFKSIMVPLDGSAFAEQALPWAACISRASGAHLELVRVFDPIPAWTVAAEGAVVATQADPALRDAEAQYLANCAARLQEGGFERVTHQLLQGEIAEAIASHAEDNAFGLVVLATHGRGALSRLWLGSVSDALVRRLTVPVLLIRPIEGGAIPRAEQFGRILVALDGSPEAESALAPALALGDPGRSELVLLRVVPPVPIAGDAGMTVALPMDDGLTRTLTDQAEGYLAGVAQRLRGRNVTIDTRVVVEPGVAQAALRVAAEEGAELIALATHGARGLRRMVLGSVADKVLRGADRPVLLTRVPDPR
ncbi:MAG TPA: universal stress protein [Gemmatimonadales bacterium]|nr:universal stress protein [Gemmatimonadales bacterium]